MKLPNATRAEIGQLSRSIRVDEKRAEDPRRRDPAGGVAKSVTPCSPAPIGSPAYNSSTTVPYR